jgi:hypothetical protein
MRQYSDETSKLPMLIDVYLVASRRHQHSARLLLDQQEQHKLDLKLIYVIQTDISMQHEQLLFAYTNVNAKYPHDFRHVHAKVFSWQSRTKSDVN